MFIRTHLALHELLRESTGDSANDELQSSRSVVLPSESFLVGSEVGDIASSITFLAPQVGGGGGGGGGGGDTIQIFARTVNSGNGDGVIEKDTDDEQQCPMCGGSGFVPNDDDDEEVIHTAS
jgi:hypothetical protein